MGRVRKTICVILVVILCLEGWSDINVRALDADTSENITVSLMKMWDDYGNMNEKRPESVEVTLLADGKEVITTKLTEQTHGIYDDYDICFAWYYKCDAVPEFNESGEKIRYTWLCEEIDGYTRYFEETGDMTIITDYQALNNVDEEEPVILKKLDENGNRLGNCLLRVTDDEEKEILRWMSGDAHSVEVAKDGVTANLNEYGDIVIYGLKNDVEYTYEELKPADGYTFSDNINFKLSTEKRNYSFNWYTSIEKAALDASKLTTENADCYRPEAEAGVFIDGDIATIILLKDTDDTQTFQLSSDTILDLNENTLNMTSGGSIQYNSDLYIEDGTIELTNASRGINGLVSATYQSNGKLKISDTVINSESSISGSRTINTYASNIEIKDCTINTLNTAGGYGLYIPNTKCKMTVENSTINAKSGSYTIYNIYSAASLLRIDSSNVETSGNATYGIYTTSGILELSDNTIISEGKGATYNVYSADTNVNIDSGKFNLTSVGGLCYAINLTGVSTSIISGGTYNAHSTYKGNNVGIMTNGSKVNLTVYGVDIDADSSVSYNYGIVNMDASVKVYGGNYNARPVDSKNGTNDAYGIAIYNRSGTMIISEEMGEVYASGGNGGFECLLGSDSTINSGTFCSPNHGGIYCSTGSSGKCEINGGLFYNNYHEYENKELGEIHPFGAGYFGSNNKTSAAWSVDVKNAIFLGNDATYGIVQRSNGGYIPATINLYNCYISGNVSDIMIQPNENVSIYNAFINIYEGTILAHETMYDGFEKNYGKSYIADYR